MLKIEEFIYRITYTRKRNGIIFLDETNVNEFDILRMSALNIVDLARTICHSPIISADRLLTMFLEVADGKPTIFLNSELYLAPRFQEPSYLSSLLPKLMHIEPPKPIILAFYSKGLYLKMKHYYQNNPATFEHWFESDA